MSHLDEVLCMPGIVEKKKEEKKEKPELPVHVKTFDPENPPFKTIRMCIYLSELEEEKEHK
jgi:hypothetical protein